MSTDTQREIDMINRPDKWPQWPFLPIKRPAKQGGWPDCALIQADNLTEVIHANLWGTEKEFNEARRQQYESIEALVADGWIVD